MKKLLSVTLAICAFASATAAGAASVPGRQDTKFTELSDCQLAQLAVCYKWTGDYVSCYEQAEQYAC